MIIAALIFAGPLTAVAITALLVVSVFLVWYLTERVGSEPDGHAEEPYPDPVTRLQARYADGELSESKFEAKLDSLLEADDRAERAGVETEELSLER